jgi:hypothetical protein
MRKRRHKTATDIFPVRGILQIEVPSDKFPAEREEKSSGPRVALPGGDTGGFLSAAGLGPGHAPPHPGRRRSSLPEVRRTAKTVAAGLFFPPSRAPMELLQAVSTPPWGSRPAAQPAPVRVDLASPCPDLWSPSSMGAPSLSHGSYGQIRAAVEELSGGATGAGMGGSAFPMAGSAVSMRRRLPLSFPLHGSRPGGFPVLLPTGGARLCSSAAAAVDLYSTTAVAVRGNVLVPPLTLWRCSRAEERCRGVQG